METGTAAETATALHFSNLNPKSNQSLLMADVPAVDWQQKITQLRQVASFTLVITAFVQVFDSVI